MMNETEYLRLIPTRWAGKFNKAYVDSDCNNLEL